MVITMLGSENVYPDSIRYEIWKLPPFADAKSYVYACASNKALAIEICEYALKENSRCKLWIKEVKDEVK